MNIDTLVTVVGTGLFSASATGAFALGVAVIGRKRKPERAAEVQQQNAATEERLASVQKVTAEAAAILVGMLQEHIRGLDKKIAADAIVIAQNEIWIDTLEAYIRTAKSEHPEWSLLTPMEVRAASSAIPVPTEGKSDA